MQIFNRSKPRDVLFLTPVRINGEKPSRTRIRMLYCDEKGRVYASPVSRSVYDAVQSYTTGRQNKSRGYATVGIETTPGDFLPAIVEINEQELWALEHTVEHALRTGKLPDILKRYLKSIIYRGASRREEVIEDFQKNRSQARNQAAPKVLDRLPYYRERDIEISMPIYKAEHSYPLIILKFLPNKNGGKSQRNLLALDSDGDLAVIKVPATLVNGVEKMPDEVASGGKRRYTCAVIHQQPRGRTVDFMTITQAQKKALDTIARYYEETGNGKNTVPAAARTVISLAGKSVTPEAR